MKLAWITAVAACWLLAAIPAHSQGHSQPAASQPAASTPSSEQAAASTAATEAAQGEQSPATKSEEGEGASPLWAWINFALLAGILGYLMVKKGGPYFASRTQAIRRGILEADEIRRNAEARAAEVDRMLAGLDAGIQGLRTSARKEQAAEAERIRRQSSADMARIQEHAAQEIESASKAARMEHAKDNAERAAKQTKIAKANEEIARANEELARRRYYAAQMNLAMQAWHAGDVPRVLELLEGQRPGKVEDDLRGFEWYYLWRLCNSGRRHLQGHTDAVLSLLRASGLSRQAAVQAHRAITSWTFGFILLRSAREAGRGCEHDPHRRPVDDAEKYPALEDLGPLLAEPPTQAEFEDGLRRIIATFVGAPPRARDRRDHGRRGR